MDLAAAGFDGTVILEVPPEYFTPYGGVTALEHSVHVLGDFVRDLTKRHRDRPA